MGHGLTVLKVLAVLCGVLLAGLLFGWLGTQSLGVRSSPPADRPATPTLLSADNHEASAAQEIRDPNAPDAAAHLVNPIVDWEDRLDEILTSGEENSDRVRRMVDLFPHLPDDGQVEVAHHLASLLSDQDYTSWEQHLTNSAMSEPVLEAMMTGLLSRPNALKLPLLLEIARDHQNPKARDAKHLLVAMLEQDYGNDWTQWRTGIQHWMADNPD